MAPNVQMAATNRGAAATANAAATNDESSTPTVGTGQLKTWDDDHEGIRSRGAVIRVHPNGFEEGKVIRPAPWHLLPDNLMIAISVVFLAIFGPVMAGIIASAVAAGAISVGIYRVIPGVIDGIKGFFWGLAKKAAPYVLNDPRNYSYLPFEVFIGLWAPLMFFWAWSRYSTHGFEVWFFLLNHVMRIGPRFRFFAHANVLFHKEGHDHKGLHKGVFRIFNYLNQWWIGMFYGQTPMSYETGHNKIHHRFDNGLDDVHTNLDLDRSKTISLFIYVPRFYLYWSGISNTWFFFNRRMWSLGWRSLSGVVVHQGIMIASLFFDWKFGLFYVVYPFIESVIFFALISYLWHAWMDPNDPSNAYVNSVTILNGKDNIWNEDYHVVHHVSTCHWTEYPAHYERNKANYAASKATIFRDCEEGELLHWLLSKQWDVLAEHFVDLEDKMTHEQKKALLLERLRATISKVPVKKD